MRTGKMELNLREGNEIIMHELKAGSRRRSPELGQIIFGPKRMKRNFRKEGQKKSYTFSRIRLIIV